MIRPSSLPMLAQCSAYESSGGEFAELGTARHSALKAHYHGDDSELDLLDEESQVGIRWAADFIRANSTESHPLEWETKRSWTRLDFSEVSGTPDVVNGPTIFDFKWRQRDYTAQVADYAQERIEQGYETVTVFLLFGANRRPEKIIFDQAAIEKVVAPILQRAETPTPTPCDYCGWCAKRLVCEALTKPAEIVGQGYAEPGLLDITTWRPSDMMALTDPENVKHLAFALTLWRKVLKKWGESVEYHALEAATKQGLQLPGYELQQRQGKQFVPDVEAAFKASGLEPQEFLKACQVRLNTSKKYPDQLGLDQVFKSKFNEPSVAAAKRTIKTKLGDFIQRAKETLQLKSVKGEEEEE